MEDKYKKAPWHNSRQELPETPHNRCVCYSQFLNGSETEMTFHKTRPGCGYKDYFTDDFGKAYDYDLIDYWRYADES